MCNAGKIPSKNPGVGHGVTVMRTRTSSGLPCSPTITILWIITSLKAARCVIQSKTDEHPLELCEKTLNYHISLERKCSNVVLCGIGGGRGTVLRTNEQ